MDVIVTHNIATVSVHWQTMQTSFTVSVIFFIVNLLHMDIFINIATILIQYFGLD